MTKAGFLGGRRKPYIIIGGVMASALLLALPKLSFISQSTGLSIFVIAIIIALFLDLSINVTFNPARALIADVTPAGIQRTKGYSWMQVVSGTFGIGAYLISLVFGNMTLIYIAAVLVLVFSITPVLLIKEPRHFDIEPTITTEKRKSSLGETLSLLFPLYGFVAFGIFVIINKTILNDAWDEFQNNFMYVCLIATIVLGAITIIKGEKHPSDKNDFQKIMLANAFSWLGIQSMFVMSYFFVQEKMIPGLDTNYVLANKFSGLISGATQNVDATAGNILSLGFLLLNLIGALLPVLLLQPLSKRIGKVRTYRMAIACMSAGYFLLYTSGAGEIAFYIGMLICGIGWSAVISLVFAIMTEKVNATKMGLFMGLFNFSIVLPAMMTPGISKLVKESTDYSILYLLIGISLLISLVGWLFVKEPNVTERKQIL